MEYILEICVDSAESAVNAQDAGASRVELCNSLPEGGTTPGYGTILSVRNNLSIDLNVLIRPRSSDFLYTDIEYDIMRRDIEMCGEAGVDGVVLGILDADGNIDVDRTSRLIEFARPMSVTFHRAFDMCRDPFNGLEDIIHAGADRVLTSGHKKKATDGLRLLASLVKTAGSDIIIMPGSGIDEKNIVEIARVTGAREFHLSGRKIIDSPMSFRRPGVAMGDFSGADEYSRKVADPEKIRNIINMLKMI